MLNRAIGYHTLTPFFILIRNLLAELDSEAQLADLQLLQSAIDIWEYGQDKRTSTSLIKLSIMAVGAILPTQDWNIASHFNSEIPFQDTLSQTIGQTSIVNNLLGNEVSSSNSLIDGNLLEAIQRINSGDIQPFELEQGDISYTMVSNFPVMDVMDTGQILTQANNHPAGYTEN